MVRRIIAENPKIDRNEVTLLIEEANKGVTTLKAQSSQNFAVDDLILVGLPKSENAEVRRVSGITDATTIEVTSALSFKHEFDDPVIKLDFDEFRVFRSIDGGATFPVLATVSIDYNSPQNTTEFLDSAGLQPYIYRFTFRNSITSTETDQSGDITQEKIIGYITVEEFKAQTGIKVNDTLVAEAISWGATNVRRELYVPREFRTGDPKTKHFLHVHPKLTFADANLDNKPIDKNDFYAYEEEQMVDGIPGVRTDVTSDIVGVDVDRQVITFSTDRPSSADKQLVIIWHETWEKLRFDDLPQTVAGETRNFNIHLKQLNKLWAVNYLFENIPFHTLQRGISNWSLNGVSIPFDYDVMQKINEDNNKRIDKIIRDVERVYTKFTGYRRPERPVLDEFVSTLNRGRFPHTHH